MESHANLARHPKTRRLMQRMGWSLPTTIGNLHLLWWWALEYAPTGDLTRFEPDQLTYDLDLGNATPEEFIDAMIYAGFIDRIGSGSAESRSGGTMIRAGFVDRLEGSTLRIHDWPDYTAKCLRPNFRRNPERWHQVLRSYGLPVITRRRSSLSNSTQNNALASESSASTGAEREPQLAGTALRAVPRISTLGIVRPTGELSESGSVIQKPGATQADTDTRLTSHSDVGVVLTEQQLANTPQLRNQIPRSLSLQPGFVEVWWPRLLDMYKTRGTPLDPNQRHELLARLCMRPNSAIKLLKHCIEHSLSLKWEHLDNTT